MHIKNHNFLNNWSWRLRFCRNLVWLIRIRFSTTFVKISNFGYPIPPIFDASKTIFEICLVTPAIEDLIVSGASSAEIKQKATEEGFINMRDYGWHKVLSGDTTLEEVMSATTVELKLEE